jgi:hypothetical protein
MNRKKQRQEPQIERADALSLGAKILLAWIFLAVFFNLIYYVRH